jgi:hypothetical protein
MAMAKQEAEEDLLRKRESKLQVGVALALRISPPPLVFGVWVFSR